MSGEHGYEETCDVIERLTRERDEARQTCRGMVAGIKAIVDRAEAAKAQRDEALALLRDLREAVDLTESALRNMGSEELHNMSTPQTVRDLCRHHADLLAKALRGGA